MSSSWACVPELFAVGSVVVNDNQCRQSTGGSDEGVSDQKLVDHLFWCQIDEGGGSVELMERSADLQTLQVSNYYYSHPSS